MNKTLEEWLVYMQGIHVSAIDMGLSRVMPVAEKLNLINTPKEAYVFTVAGTNGKGSTTAAIAEICKQAGYKTGLYQSPHLINFNERVKINGVPVTDGTLISAFEEVEKVRLECGLSLSFFEMTTLATFLIFRHMECDVWVLEIGLGGRLDVVNIVDPDISVITNIGVDHVDWLGSDRETIGYEKAGILRQGVPLIFGDDDMPKSVQARIDELSIDCYQRTIDFGFLNGSNRKITQNTWQYSSSAITLQLPKPTLSLINTSNAITAVLASSLEITGEDIASAMCNIKLAGRFDLRVINNKKWLFDVAHNKEGVEFFLNQLEPRLPELSTSSNVYIIFSMLKDKDIDTVVKLLTHNQSLANLNISWYVAPIDNTYCPRSADLDMLKDVLIKYINNDVIFSFDNLVKATDSVMINSNEDDLILVCGSFHTISECLTAIDLIE